jgi:hypothetical protein
LLENQHGVSTAPAKVDVPIRVERDPHFQISSSTRS